MFGASREFVRWLAVLTPVLGLVASVGCWTPATGDHGAGSGPPPSFLTPVAQAQQSGLTVYWLGETVDVDGLAFRVGAAKVAGLNGGAPLQFEYYADLDKGTVGATFRISNDRAYDQAVTDQRAKPVRATETETHVYGWPATSFAIAATRWTNQKVIVGAPGAVVEVTAGAAIDDGRQVNPLNDPNVLLRVLNENLRPYPQ